jgi:hypothetical protein
MLAAPAPAHGDVVVRQEEREGTLVYVLHTAPGPDQYLLRTREEAVARALTFAKGTGVQAWLASGESSFHLLGDSHALKSPEDSLQSAAAQPHDAWSPEPSIRPIHAVVARVRGEYLEVPGLRLNAEEAHRLCGLEPPVCQSVLDALVDAKFLHVTADGQYVRLTDGEIRRAESAKAASRSVGIP